MDTRPICNHYLSLFGCKSGDQCRFQHIQIPSLWTAKISKDSKYPVYSTQLSASFSRFTQYFTYPYYLRLTSFDALEITDSFTHFNACDWNILLNTQYFLMSPNRNPYDAHAPRHILYQFDITSVCIFILRIITLHKSSNRELIKSWKTVLNSLSVQNVLSTKRMLSNSDIFAKELFAIYAAHHAERDGKIPLLAYKYYNCDLDTYTWHPIDQYVDSGTRYKLVLNRAFESIGFKNMSDLLSHFGEKIKLYPADHESSHKPIRLYRDKSNNMIEELMLFYIWNDYYVQLYRAEINRYLADQFMDGNFGNDLFQIVKLYVIDMNYSEFMKNHTHCENLLMDKKRLRKYIKAIHSFDTNIPTRDRRVWRRYLLDHYITRVFYT